jgi:hypothetical protein
MGQFWNWSKTKAEKSSPIYCKLKFLNFFLSLLLRIFVCIKLLFNKKDACSIIFKIVFVIFITRLSESALLAKLLPITEGIRTQTELSS